MKRFIILMLTICLALSLTACGNNENPSESTPSTTPGASVNTPPEYPEIDYLSLDLTQYVTLGNYKDMDIEISKKPVITEEDVMKKIASDLLSNGYSEKVTDRAVTKEDTISISFVGLLDGVAFQGGTGDKDNFTMYDGGGFIDGFADGLVGAMPGVETAINVTFPEKYHSADLAGKPAVFKVTVHHIYEAKELTDEIANELTKGEHKTAASLIEYYTTNMNKDNDTEYNNKKSDLVWGEIFKNISNVNIPESMIKELYDYQIYWAQYYADAYNMDLDTFLAYDGYTRESLKESIKENILTNMVVYSIMKAENVTLTDEDYKNYIENSGYSEEEWLKEYTKEEMKEMFAFTKTYDEAVKWNNFIETEPTDK